MADSRAMFEEWAKQRGDVGRPGGFTHEAAWLGWAARDAEIERIREALRYYTDAKRAGDTCGGGYYALEDDGEVARSALSRVTPSSKEPK